MAGPEGNQNAVVHGGESAINAIKEERPLTGLAHEAEMAVTVTLEEKGSRYLILENAIRLQAASDLYWAAVEKAAQDGDLMKLDRYVARFGWLASISLRAWAQVRQDEANRPKDLDGMIEALAKGKPDETTNQQ